VERHHRSADEFEALNKLRTSAKLLQEIAMKRTLLRSFAFVTALTLTAFSTALAGPPWIAIEYPANPFDRTSRDAFLTVRTYHHGDLMAKTVTGTAEGVVNGKRQSMPLDIRPGSQAGMYVVRWQRPAVGRWVLVINSGMQGVTDATAVVDISPTGGVASVTVPTRAIGNGWISPRPVAAAEIDGLLQGRALASAGTQYNANR
jgi:hypothetical protein